MIGVINIYYASEIVEAIEKRYKNIDELLPILSDLFESTQESLVRNRVLRICKEYELCPLCFAGLTIDTISEYRGEYGDQRVFEDIYIRSCRNCGWRDSYS